MALSWGGTVLAVLWVCGIAYSWLSCGLIGDGSYYLFDAVAVGPYRDVGHERAVPNLLAQLPLAAALAAGVTDLHWLARLQSLGWFALPAILYSCAILRTRQDPVQQASVVVAIAVVFLTSSFLIVAEHVTAYAIATMAAAWLATARRLQVDDGVVLLVLGVLSTLTHEVFVYLGPLLAAMTVWTVRRTPVRSPLAAATYLAAAVVFLVSAVLAWRAITAFEDQAYFASASSEARDFWKNPAFDLASLAALVVAGFVLMRPADLATMRPWVLAAPALVALVLLPLLVLTGGYFGPPFAYGQNITRFAAGPVLVAIILFMWAHPKPPAARRLLSFAGLLFLATLPWNATLAVLLTSYLDEVKAAIGNRPGVIAYEDTRLPTKPWLLQGEVWSLPITSAILRKSSADGIIAPPRGYAGFLPYAASDLPELGRFRWRD
ncbi:hypothetical protein SAMN02990966_02349 [Rhodospirillales bacterium URHD0017]|nr:hypothetical protein SAMN02990966_02349 [Rhodospirillales bacterium URHD0017]